MPAGDPPQPYTLTPRLAARIGANHPGEKIPLYPYDRYCGFETVPRAVWLLNLHLFELNALDDHQQRISLGTVDISTNRLYLSHPDEIYLPPIDRTKATVVPITISHDYYEGNIIDAIDGSETVADLTVIPLYKTNPE